MSEERFIYEGDDVVMVFDASGNLLERYLHGPAVDQVLAEEDASHNVTWLLPNHQGSVRNVVDSDGKQVEERLDFCFSCWPGSTVDE